MSFRKQFAGYGTGTWKTYDLYDNQEWKLAESMAVEFTDIAGINAIYYNQDTSIESDVLYGEAQDREYLEGRETKVVYEVGESPSTYSMFGIIATDQIVMHIPKAVYRRDVSQTVPPKVGDVVVIPFYRDVPDMTNPTTPGRTFELVHVVEDQNIFQLQSLVYTLYTIPYRFSEESQDAADISSDITTETPSITAYGDNEWIEEKSDEINAYKDIDRSIYGK